MLFAFRCLAAPFRQLSPDEPDDLLMSLAATVPDGHERAEGEVDLLRLADPQEVDAENASAKPLGRFYATGIELRPVKLIRLVF